MAAFDDLTSAITVKYNTSINKFASSIFTYLSLNNFWYYRVTNTGTFTFFGTHISCCEYFAANHLYRDYYYYRHPRFFQSGISLQKAVIDPSSVNMMQNYNLNHSLLMMEKTRDGIEGFGFSAEHQHESQLNRMLSEIPLLRLFTEHFRKENPQIFKQLETHKIDLKRLIGSTFDTPPQHPPTPQQTEKQKLLKKLGMDFLDDLSTHEIQIVKRLLDGYSASQIATHVYRSKRTIEHSLERIKEKMYCASKLELIQKARYLETLGLLS